MNQYKINSISSNSGNSLYTGSSPSSLSNSQEFKTQKYLSVSALYDKTFEQESQQQYQQQQQQQHMNRNINQDPNTINNNSSANINSNNRNFKNKSQIMLNNSFSSRFFESIFKYMIRPFLIGVSGSIGISVGYILFDIACEKLKLKLENSSL
ncbi:hypothetical protein DLAC_11465 [Tieghemostelium lacteum]|uniref:Transmembrane protein n=1 Tax=Tieghemostelium lacteum TaxID=361077 RepID=A0A152A7W7_TIELA|nr:hypothetical protein DLAC_11465 [Tieghemostelium lacteum]|eukprot:KYR02340.1 hypothetical protein DLAC_11465 [Tieghemostelium lacteum]